MKLENNTLQRIIQKRFNERQTRQAKGTWSDNELNKKDIPNIRQFYNNSFRRGLIEYPEKRPHPKPYSTNNFNFNFFLKYYLKTILKQGKIKRE